jgi:hypothetical protein
VTDHAPDPGEHDMTDHTDLLDRADALLEDLGDPDERTYRIVAALDDALRALLAERDGAEAKVTYLLQALWDVYGILGFDQDGDATPAAVKGDLADLVRNAAREARRDYDEALQETYTPDSQETT